MIKIEHLNKTYKSNKVKALDDINIEIKKGDIYGIVGLLGAGKSSLVRCINRLEEADSGKIIINNVDILSLSKKELIEQRKKIGMIFQSFNLFSSKTIFENIAYPLRLAKMSEDKIKLRVEELLDIVELKEKKDTYPSQLSGEPGKSFAGVLVQCLPLVDPVHGKAASELEPGDVLEVQIQNTVGAGGLVQQFLKATQRSPIFPVDSVEKRLRDRKSVV